ncbi:MAG: hypothetical protein V3T05_09435, partial [Myxococcota bacterium]
MPRVFHVSDLHLTSAADEQDYSLAVLREVVEQTRSCGADALLICGHLFDASADLDAIASPLRDILADLPCTAFLIPGAGELDGRQSARLQE